MTTRSLACLLSMLIVALVSGACDSDSINNKTRDLTCQFTVTPLPGIYRDAQLIQVEAGALQQQVRYVRDTPAVFPSRQELAGPITSAQPNKLALNYSQPITLEQGLQRFTVFDPCHKQWWAYNYVIDGSAPFVSISPSSGLYRPPLTVTIEAPTADFVWARIYAVDHNPPVYAPLTAPLTITLNGEWRIDALAADLAGNQSTASVELTTNSLSPVILSATTLSGFNNTARFPGISLIFDQDMATETVYLENAFQQKFSGQTTAAVLFWQSQQQVILYPFSYLDGVTTYELNVSQLTNRNGFAVAQLQNGQAPRLPFTTRDSAPTGQIFGSIAATSTVPLIYNSASAMLTVYVTLSPPPLNPSELLFMAFVTDRVGQPQLDFPNSIEVIGSSLTTTQFRLLFNGQRAWPVGQVAALGFFALSDQEQYVADDYLGVYVAPATPPTGLSIAGLANGGVLALAESAQQAYLRFDAVPSAHSFAAAISAERIRSGIHTAITPIWDYLGMSAGTSLRLRHNQELQHGDLVIFYIAGGALTGLAGGVLASHVTAPLSYSAQSLDPPQQFRTNLNQRGEVNVVGNNDLLTIITDRRDRQFTAWSIRLTAPIAQLPLPIFTATPPLVSNPNGPSMLRLRTLPDVDPLPANTLLNLHIELTSAGGANHQLVQALRINSGAYQLSNAEPLGSCSAVRIFNNSAAAVNCGVRLNATVEQIDFDFFAVLDDLTLTPDSNQLGRYRSAQTLFAAAKQTLGYQVPFSEGLLIGEYVTPDQQRFALRSLELLPTNALPLALTAPITTTTSPLALTFIPGSNTARIDSYGVQIFSTNNLNHPVLDIRQPGLLPGLNIPAQTLAAGHYIWFIYGVSSLADPFNPFTNAMYDLGFAVSATAPLTILPP